MGGDLSQRLVPDDLWALVEPVLPSFRSRPQGGGTAPIDQRTVFTAVVYVLTSGCTWRYLPPMFGVSPATAHPRFSVSLPPEHPLLVAVVLLDPGIPQHLHGLDLAQPVRSRGA